MARSYNKDATSKVYKEVTSGFKRVDQLSDKDKGDLYQYLIDTGEKDVSKFNPKIVNQYGLTGKVDVTKNSFYRPETDPYAKAIQDLESVFQTPSTGVSTSTLGDTQRLSMPSYFEYLNEIKKPQNNLKMGSYFDYLEQVQKPQVRPDETTPLYGGVPVSKDFMPGGSLGQGEAVTTGQYPLQEQMVQQSIEESTVPSRIAGLGASLGSTAGSMLAAPMQAAKELGRLDPFVNLQEMVARQLTGNENIEAKPWYQTAGEKGQEVLEPQMQQWGETISRFPRADRMFLQAVGQAPQYAMQGLATLGGPAGQTAALGTMGAVAAANKMREIEQAQIEAGIDVNSPKAVAKRFVAGVLSGGIEVATEKLPYDEFTKILNKGVSMEAIGKEMIEEFLGEGLAEAGDYVINWAFMDNYEVPELMEAAAGVGEAAGIGALSALFFGMAASSVNSVRDSARKAMDNPTQENIDEALNQFREAIQAGPEAVSQRPTMEDVDKTTPTQEEVINKELTDLDSYMEELKQSKFAEEFKQRHPDEQSQNMFDDIMNRYKTELEQVMAEGGKEAITDVQQVEPKQSTEEVEKMPVKEPEKATEGVIEQDTTKEEPKVYRYMTTQRPPSPGAVPRGAVNTEMFDDKTDGAWGYVEYSEPLTQEQIEDYELTPSITEQPDVIDAEARIEEVIDEFGTTEYPEDAGYLLPSGEMLDFGSGYGIRDTDHRAVARPDEDQTDGMLRFMEETGSVRMAVDNGNVLFNVHGDIDLTKQQINAMKRMAAKQDSVTFEYDPVGAYSPTFTKTLTFPTGNDIAKAIGELEDVMFAEPVPKQEEVVVEQEVSKKTAEKPSEKETKETVPFKNSKLAERIQQNKEDRSKATELGYQIGTTLSADNNQFYLSKDGKRAGYYDREARTLNLDDGTVIELTPSTTELSTEIEQPVEKVQGEVVDETVRPYQEVKAEYDKMLKEDGYSKAEAKYADELQASYEAFSKEVSDKVVDRLPVTEYNTDRHLSEQQLRDLGTQTLAWMGDLEDAQFARSDIDQLDIDKELFTDIMKERFMEEYYTSVTPNVIEDQINDFVDELLNVITEDMPQDTQQPRPVIKKEPQSKLSKQEQEQVTKQSDDYAKKYMEDMVKRQSAAITETQPTIYKTGAKATTNVYRGTGKTKGKEYTSFMYPILGKGTYYAMTEDNAKLYGDNIESKEVTLNNPYVINDDVDFKRITEKAGWKYPNITSFSKDEAVKLIDNLRDMMVEDGYDGIIVQYEDNVRGDENSKTGNRIKTIKNMFGHDQIVSYAKPIQQVKETEKKATKATEKATEVFDYTEEEYKSVMKANRPSLTDEFFNSGVYRSRYENALRKAHFEGQVSDRISDIEKETLNRFDKQATDAEEAKVQREKSKQLEKETQKKIAEEKEADKQKRVAEAKKRQDEMLSREEERKSNIYKKTKDEYVTQKRGPAKELQEYEHRQAVEQALAEGKNVSDNVLKDYPDLLTSINEPDVVSLADSIRSEYNATDDMFKQSKIIKAALTDYITQEIGQPVNNNIKSELASEVNTLSGAVVAYLEGEPTSKLAEAQQVTKKKVTKKMIDAENIDMLTNQVNDTLKYLGEMNKSTGAKKQPVNYDMTKKDVFVDMEKDFIDLRKGNMPFEKLESYVDYVVNNEASIKEAAGKRTKPQLAKYVSVFNRNDFNKPQYVDSAYSEQLNNIIYTLSGDKTISTTGFDRASRMNQLRDKISNLMDGMTKDKYQEVVDRINAEQEDRKTKALEQANRVENPKTLEDFQLAVKKRVLTKEEKRTYEDLKAANKLKATEVKEEKPVVENLSEYIGDMTEGKNTKTGDTIYEFGLTDRLSKDQWSQIKGIVSKNGGSYWKGKFYFTTDSQTKAAELRQNVIDELQGKTVEQEETTSNVPEKLRTLADNMQKSIDDKFADRQTNTARRAAMAASANMDGDKLKRTQAILRQIADKLEAGEMTYLSKISSRTQVEELDYLMGRAKYDYLKDVTKEYDSFAAEMKRKELSGEPVNVDTVDFAKLPRFYRDHIVRALQDASTVKGLIQDSKKALRSINRTEGDVVAAKYMDIVKKMIDSKIIDTYSSLKSTYDSVSRMNRLGIETDGDLRAALREYIQFYNTTSVSKDEQIQRNIKQRESEFTRQKIEGFFPTPKSIVRQMVDIADITANDKVLEPSAGVGHIADEITTGNLEVIEYNNSMAELLKDKGFNVVGNDALQATGKYNKIVMNPPFEKGADIDHVMYAYENNLAEGGRLVAIMSEGPFFRNDKKAKEFRDWYSGLEAYDEKLPDKAFMESDRQTGVSTRMVVIEKPSTAGLKEIKKVNPNTTTKEVVKGAESTNKLIRKADKPSKAKPVLARYNKNALKTQIENGTLSADELIISKGEYRGYNWNMKYSIAEAIQNRDSEVYELVIHVPDDGTLTLRNDPEILADTLHALKISAVSEELPMIVSKYVRETEARIVPYGDYKIITKGGGKSALFLTDNEYTQYKNYVDQVKSISANTKTDFTEVAKDKVPAHISTMLNSEFVPVDNYIDVGNDTTAVSSGKRTLAFDKKLLNELNGNYNAYLSTTQPILILKDDNGLLVGLALSKKYNRTTANFVPNGDAVTVKPQAFTKPSGLKWTLNKADLEVQNAPKNGPKAAVAYVPKLIGIEATQAKEIAKLSDATKLINKYIQVPVEKGKFRQRALGIYKGSGIIRVKNRKQMDVLMHEVGHYFDQNFNLYHFMTDAQKSELAVAGKPVSRDTYTKRMVIEEGIAEFFSTYLQSKPLAQKNFPLTYGTIDSIIQNDKTSRLLTHDLNELMSQYVSMNSPQKVLSNVQMKSPKMSKVKPSEMIHEIYSAMVDSNHPIYRAEKDVVGPIDKAYSPLSKIRLSATSGIGKMQTAMERGIIDPKTYKFLSKGFYEIIKPIQESKQFEDFVAYAVAKRASELEARGIETGIPMEDVEATIKEFQSDQKFNSVLKEIYKFQDTLLKVAVNNDLIEQSAYEAIKEVNKNYIPFNRVLEKANGKGKSGSTIKQIKGSELDIINPLESIVRNTYAIYNAIDTNAAYKKFFALADKPGAGKYFDQIPTPMIPIEIQGKTLGQILKDNYDVDLGTELEKVTMFQPNNFPGKDNVVSVLKNGKRVFYEIHDKKILKAISKTNQPTLDMITKILGTPARALRAGATEFSDSFMLRNFIRDTVSASVFSQNGFIPFVHSVRGVFEQAGATDLYYKALSSGALNNSVSAIDRDYIKKNTRKLYTKDFKEGVFDKIKHPIDLMRGLNEGVESSTRLGEFRQAYEKAIANGMSEEAAITKAALASRDLMDFMRAGYLGREINKVVTFFNASIQGTDKVIRSAATDPLGFTLRGAGYLTAMSVILHLMYSDDDRYDRLDRYTKDMYWVFFVGDEIIRIPKPHELGLLFGTGIERMLDFMKTKDPKAFKEYKERTLTTILPEFIPQVIKVPFEIMTNYSMFYDGPIVPISEQYAPKYMQYGHSTSEFAKMYGKAFNRSPRMVDYAVQNSFGTAGTFVIDRLDDIITLVGMGDQIEEPSGTALQSIPFIRGLVKSPLSSSHYVQDFYDYYGEIQEENKEYNVLGEGKPSEFEKTLTYVNKMNKYMSGMNKAARLIKESGLSGDEKKSQLLDVIELQDAIAKHTLNGTKLTGVELTMIKQYMTIWKGDE